MKPDKNLKQLLAQSAEPITETFTNNVMARVHATVLQTAAEPLVTKMQRRAFIIFFSAVAFACIAVCLISAPLLTLPAAARAGVVRTACAFVGVFWLVYIANVLATRWLAGRNMALH